MRKESSQETAALIPCLSQVVHHPPPILSGDLDEILDVCVV